MFMFMFCSVWVIQRKATITDEVLDHYMTPRSMNIDLSAKQERYVFVDTSTSRPISVVNEINKREHKENLPKKKNQTSGIYCRKMSVYSLFRLKHALLKRPIPATPSLDTFINALYSFIFFYFCNSPTANSFPNVGPANPLICLQQLSICPEIKR